MTTRIYLHLCVVPNSHVSSTTLMERESLVSTYRRIIVLAAFLIAVFAGASRLSAQENASDSSVLHIRRSVTTSNHHSPQFIYTYQVLGGANSTAEADKLTGTISLKNYTPNFSEVLWLIAYWQGNCPSHPKTLKGANFIWSDILKNPSQSDSKFDVDLRFPHPLPMTGCVGLVFGGGPLVQGKVKMSADLNLTYQAVSSNANGVFDFSGEYCFGQNWGCQNATLDDHKGFGLPVTMFAGHLVELFGNISDSTFDGTNNFGPLPTGKQWGAINDFYLLPGGCGQFGNNLNKHGFPKPTLLSTLYSWIPSNAVDLASVPMEYKIPQGGNGEAALQKPVEKIFSNPIPVNSGDCMVVIYGRTGNGATDNETQVHAVLTP